MKISKKEMTLLFSQQRELRKLVMENHRILEHIEELLGLILAQNIVAEYDFVLQNDASIRHNLLERLACIIANVAHTKI